MIAQPERDPTWSRARARLALLLLLCIGFAALCHVHGHLGYVDRLDTELTLLAPAVDRSRSGVPVPAGTERLWVVIADGLRADALAEMPFLQRLAAAGSLRVLVAEFPSYTYASLTTLVTGIIPFYSGVRLNSGRPHPRFDTLLSLANRMGVGVFVSAREWRDFDRALDAGTAPSVEHVPFDALPFRTRRRELGWIHLDEVDAAGHRRGAASELYRAAARHVDAQLASVASALDFEQDTLVVLSDHGHLDRGGHGGDEPDARRGIFVAVGPKVRSQSELAPARLRDVCATIAALAGLPPPSDNLGTPMLDLMRGGTHVGATMFAPVWDERERADARLGGPLQRDPALLARLASGDAAALHAAISVLALYDAGLERSRTAELAARCAHRLGYAVALVACLLSVWLIPRSIRPRLRDALPIVAYGLIFGSLYLLAGYRLSWSLPRGYASFIVETSLAGAVAGGVCLAVGRWRRLGGDPHRQTQRASFVFPIGALYVIAAAIAGTDAAWLEGPRHSFFLVLIATAGFYAALALAAGNIWALLAKRPPR